MSHARADDWRTILALLAPVVASITAASVAYLTIMSGSHLDLDTFAHAARAAVEGTSPYVGGVPPFVYPPGGLLVAFVALPGPGPWVALSLAALARTVWLLTRAAWPELARSQAAARACWVFALLCVLEPTLLCLGFGQVGLVLLWLVVEALVPRPRSGRAVLLGLAIAVKLTPAYLLAVLAAAGRWRAIGWAVGGAVAATLAVAVVFPDTARAYLAGAWRLPLEVNTTIDAQNHSLMGLAQVIGLPAWVGQLAAMSVAVWGVAIAARQLRAGDELAGVAVGLLAGLLVSPISWTHHWVAVYPVLVLLARQLDSRGARLLGAVGVAGLLLWVDVLGAAINHVQVDGGTTEWWVVVQQQWAVWWGCGVLVWATRALKPVTSARTGRGAVRRGVAAAASP